MDCGLIFLSLRMTAEAYRDFYECGHYRKLLTEFYGKPMTPTSIEAEQAHYADRLSDWLRPHMDKLRGGLLLDLGGSTGVVAERLSKDFNLDGTVVEPAPPEPSAARDRGLAVANVRLEDNAAGGNHYDLVTLCQTVDHQLDIRGALGRIRALLAPGGLFFVDFVENGPLKVDHPYYLTQKTMRRYVERAGFRVKALEPSSDGLHVNVLCEAA
jgi:2-polyprenyl-3-methyl-5-hydroxy-6-metoxy-1,4-benzoquinol methylase